MTCLFLMTLLVRKKYTMMIHLIIFGTQPKLLNLTIDLVDHVDPSAIEYYQSEIFKKKYLFVGNTTHKKIYSIYYLITS